jgi:hypothetical protein
MQKQTARTVQRGRDDVRPGKFFEAIDVALRRLICQQNGVADGV